MGKFKDLDIDRQENDKENKEFYNRTHFFGTPELDDDSESDDYDDDDFLISEDF